MNLLLTGVMAFLAIEYIGIAQHFLPLLKTLRFTLLISVVMFAYSVFRYGLSEVVRNAAVKALLVFICLTAFAMVHGLIRSYAIGPLRTELGMFMFLAIVYYSLRTPKSLSILALWMVAIHVVLVALNVDHLLKVERIGGFKAGYFLGDGNDFAWSMNIALGFAVFLLATKRSLLVRVFAAAGAAVILFGVIGTQSRGATLALSAALLYFWVYVSKRKTLGIVALVVVAAGVLTLAPEHYFSRIQTIATYEEDSSAMGRLTAWGRATQMAVDHPVLGVGAGSFNSAYGRFYKVEGDPARWISTHSVYFKVLAEYSFLGAALYVMVIVFNIRQNRRTSKLLASLGGRAPLPVQAPEFINMSIVAFAVAAAFLSGVDYPHMYLLTAVTMAIKRIAEEEAGRVPGDVDQRIATADRQTGSVGG